MTRYPEDVAQARQGARNAVPTYGPRRARRTAADTWQDFSDRYGWRAYALPVLVIITIAALLSTTSPHKKPAAAADQKPAAAAGARPHTDPTATQPLQAPSSMTLKADQPGANSNNTAPNSAALPSGGPYTVQGDGTFRELKGTTKVVGHGPLYRYDIEVENGITGVDLTRFQDMVERTLADPRSWSGHGVSLQRVDSGSTTFHITLTSAMSVRHLCGYTIPVETSCYASAGGASDVNRVVFNVARWVRGAAAYLGDLNAYRVYMINHEVGHALGHQHAHQCLSDGLAPAMMQQTFGLRSAVTHQLCQANPWPYPPGATDAPGAEQPDTAQNDEYGLGDG
jgi:hypothetical protein